MAYPAGLESPARRYEDTKDTPRFSPYPNKENPEGTSILRLDTVNPDEFDFSVPFTPTFVMSATESFPNFPSLQETSTPRSRAGSVYPDAEDILIPDPVDFSHLQVSPSRSLYSAYSTLSGDEELAQLKGSLMSGASSPGFLNIPFDLLESEKDGEWEAKEDTGPLDSAERDSRLCDTYYVPSRTLETKITRNEQTSSLRSPGKETVPYNRDSAPSVSPEGGPRAYNDVFPSGEASRPFDTIQPSFSDVPEASSRDLGSSLNSLLPEAPSDSSVRSHKSRNSWFAPRSRDASKGNPEKASDLTDSIMPRLQSEYYRELTLKWDDMTEISLFGGLLGDLFHGQHTHDVLFNYVLHATPCTDFPQSYASGLDITLSKAQLFDIIRQQDFLGRYKRFTATIAEMKEQSNDSSLLRKSDTANFHALRENGDLTLGTLTYKFPLASVLYLNWLLQYGETSALSEKYTRYEILPKMYFVARCSYIIDYLFNQGYFSEAMTTKNGQEHLLSRFVDKDNQIALALALAAIANYYQDRQAFNHALHYYECGANVCCDLDCLRMTIMGLSSGVGYGNVKDKDSSANVLHMARRKRLKFENKRRIAQLYRLMEKKSGVQEFGGSWVWKKKYD
ncbi:hypothetical protein BABINDRAFT_160776 [Babjeviella inositovora NRRL Y-12698]|uniref:Uncharacterized protein n=1 Tax=Babjeviella inositovora NRRL Y-12698 TaxID=984486 RepID=A0A1E3QU29_9ASCO|nr:uncharacterized protein BABINDRAFT_160776 [Babjeviella inositovora NRRL Y-12698]ODQ80502.1 hypothetical protein BABINDRAFT_160776 [Babjeviella inositovora NRRL Y-12698]